MPFYTSLKNKLGAAMRSGSHMLLKAGTAWGIMSLDYILYQDILIKVKSRALIYPLGICS